MVGSYENNCTYILQHQFDKYHAILLNLNMVRSDERYMLFPVSLTTDDSNLDIVL